MTYTPTIYDWPADCAPVDQVFRAGGQAIEGGMTLGGAMASNPEPGGRAELHLNFATFVTDAANRAASWLISRITNGAIMRVRLWDTTQLVPWADLDVPDVGQAWADASPWANDAAWATDPYAPITAVAAKGAEVFTADLSIIGQVLEVGHVIGFEVSGYHFAHVVMAISYGVSDAATVTVSPPLRRALAVTDDMLFRPSMLVTCRNASEVAGTFRRGLHMGLNSAKLVEALV